MTNLPKDNKSILETYINYFISFIQSHYDEGIDAAHFASEFQPKEIRDIYILNPDLTVTTTVNGLAKIASRKRGTSKSRFLEQYLLLFSDPFFSNFNMSCSIYPSKENQGVYTIILQMTDKEGFFDPNLFETNNFINNSFEVITSHSINCEDLDYNKYYILNYKFIYS